MWKRSIDKYVHVNNFGQDWLVGITIRTGENTNESIPIICFYFPYQSPGNEEEFLTKLGILSGLINDSDVRDIFIIGDFNANISNDSSFGQYLEIFCDENNLINASKAIMPPDTHTFVSERWNTTSWLDHCLSTSSAFNLIDNCNVRHDLCSSDHIPLEIIASVDDMIPIVTLNPRVSKIHWDKLDSGQLMEYTNITHNSLFSIDTPQEALDCNNLHCCDPSHINAYAKYHDEIVNALVVSGDLLKTSDKGRKPMPGWNEHVREAHRADIEAYYLWLEAGKPTAGVVYDLKKSRHRDYKNSVNFVKKNEQRIINDELANNLLSMNKRDFWKNIKGLKNSHNIEGVSGEEYISNFWKEHYISLFNCGYEYPVTEVEIGSEKPVEISDDEILKCIVNLKLYKSPGPDLVTAEHVQYASSIIVPMLRRLISAILVHGVLPSSMSNLELVPIPKDKKGKLNDQNNYRPIALASCFSKILEMCIFNRIKEFIKTESNQFGYKPGLGTDSCIYTLKEIITNNMKNSTNTFIAFLDASKAFDKINHDLLFEKLLNAGTPRYMVRVISNWYRSQNLRVRWGSSLYDIIPLRHQTE